MLKNITEENYKNTEYYYYMKYFIKTAYLDKKDVCGQEIYNKTKKDFFYIAMIKPETLIIMEKDELKNKRDILAYTIIKLSILCYELDK